MIHRLIGKSKRSNNIHNGNQNHDQTEKHATEQSVCNSMITAIFDCQGLVHGEFLEVKHRIKYLPDPFMANTGSTAKKSKFWQERRRLLDHETCIHNTFCSDVSRVKQASSGTDIPPPEFLNFLKNKMQF